MGLRNKTLKRSIVQKNRLSREIQGTPIPQLTCRLVEQLEVVLRQSPLLSPLHQRKWITQEIKALPHPIKSPQWLPSRVKFATNLVVAVAATTVKYLKVYYPTELFSLLLIHHHHRKQILTNPDGLKQEEGHSGQEQISAYS